ncbi:MAG: hypothetical protein IPJ39_14415 [Saprospiraceae bacterium]|nr:hypothetical protein [Saprospiraceae bacterium]
MVKQSNYIKPKPIHISQMILQESDESMMIAIEVIPNFEMEAVILGIWRQWKLWGLKMDEEKIGRRCERMVGGYV